LGPEIQPIPISTPKGTDLIPSLKGRGFQKLDKWIEREQELTGAGHFNNIVPKIYSIHQKEGKKSFGGAVEEKTFSIYKLQAANDSVSGFNLSDLMASFSTVVEKLLKEVTHDLAPNDQVQVILSEESGTMAAPVSSKLKAVSEFDFQTFLLQAESYFQSEREISLDDGVRLEFVSVKMGKTFSKLGKGGTKTRFTSSVEALLKKKSCVVVHNKDNLCIPRCLAIGLSYKGISHVNTRQIRNSSRSIQKKEAIKLCEKSNVSYAEKCGLEEIQKFEQALKISIKIFDINAFLEIVYSGPIFEDTKAVLYLVRSDEGNDFHYDYISNVCKFLNKNFFCDHCNFAYNAIHSHCCSDIEDWCYSCYDRTCIQDLFFEEKCKICQRKFRNEECKKNHSDNPKSNCGYFKCFDCNKIMKRQFRNNVWESNIDLIIRHGSCKIECKICKEQVDGDHVCFMKKIPFKKHIKKVVYFDFETEATSGVHIPIFCHLRWIFQKSDEIVEKGEKSFGVSTNVSSEVCKFLFSNFFKGSTIIAHNAKGFDGCFLMQYLIQNNLKPSNVVLDGTKITYMTIPSLQMRMIDSLNLIPIRLAQFAKSFGLQESGKGYFPYIFIRPENFNYIGPFPEKEQYGYNEMKPQDREAFCKWYDEIPENSVFDFNSEIKKYCVQDVRILELGVEEFRKQILVLTTNEKKPKEYEDEETEYEDNDQDEIENENECSVFKNEIAIDVLFPTFSKFIAKTKKQKSPRRKNLLSETEMEDFQKEKENFPNNCDPISYCTLASLCHGIFKAQYLKEKTIAQVPPGGYLNHKYSNKSIEWLEFQNHKNKLKIIHKRNSSKGEVRIARFRVDGFEKETKTIYEFNGCFFHGHPKCVSNMSSINPVMKISYDCLFKRTLNKKKALERQGFKVITKWECEWEKERKSVEIENFLKEHQIVSPLNPKDAFFGGRVEAFTLIDEKPEEKKFYLDVTSLYPFVVAKKKFPIGHPIIIIQNFDLSLDSYFGFVKCVIVPPRQLLIPVLPVRVNGKLLFPLCKTCAEQQIKRQCFHSNSERKIEGTWFSEELKLAVKKGYSIEKIHEVYHFETQSSKLFTKFMNQLYKIKLLASGKPENINLSDFISTMKEKEGIDLTNSNFEKNAGLRYIAKLLLNSFWGRFALRENMAQFKFISDLGELYKFIEDENVDINRVRCIKNNMVAVAHQKKNISLLDISNNQNIYIAAITTAWARIELYGHLDKLSTNSSTQVLYCDTDSIIFNSAISPFQNLETGPFIGDLTNELNEEEFISEFISAGPKNYSYKTSEGNSCIKIKGFSLHFENQKAFKPENTKIIIQSFISNNCNEYGFVELSDKKERDLKIKQARSDFFIKHSETPFQSSAFHSNFAISTYNPRKISRDNEWTILSIKEQKVFAFNYDKRIIKKDASTIPFGYCDND
jgi:hypothetical protein